MTGLTEVLGRGTCETPGPLWDALLGGGLRRAAARHRRRERAPDRAAPHPFPDAGAERDVWFALGRGCCEL